MENTDQEKTAAPSMSEMLTKSANQYWEMFGGEKSGNGMANAVYFPWVLRNGTMKKLENACMSTMKMWGNWWMNMYKDGAAESLPKIFGELPEMMAEIQQKELDNFLKWHSKMIASCQNFDRLTRLLCLRTLT